jgi:hypothetical protein
MNPDIVYLHTSLDPSRVNALWVSAYSVKRIAPQLRIRCLVASDELPQLVALMPLIIDGYIEWVPLDIPAGSAAYRSRWMKTQLVRWLEGPSLFLDSDTLLVKPFEWGEMSSFSFATAVNRVADQGFKEVPTRINGVKKFAAAGWDWDSKLDGFYRNSGVMYIVPSSRVERIFKAWHQKWLEFVARSGHYVDQPALNVVLLEQGWSERLPDHWNAPVRAIPEYCRGALIHHYYASLDRDEDASFTLFGELVHMMSEGRFEPAVADKLIDRGKVYVAMGGRIKGYLLAGQYGFMLRSILRKYLRKCLRRSS